MNDTINIFEKLLPKNRSVTGSLCKGGRGSKNLLHSKKELFYLKFDLTRGGGRAIVPFAPPPLIYGPAEQCMIYITVILTCISPL